VTTPEATLAAPDETLETEQETEGLRFDDPYWDDVFCTWWDPALRTCCS